MALTPTERTGPSGYVPFPVDVVLDDRTGQSPLAMEMLSLEGALPVGTIVRAAGDVSLQFSVLGPLLSGKDPGDSITSSRTPVVIDVPAWTSFIAPAEDARFPLLLVRRTRITDPALKIARQPALAARAMATGPAVTPADELRAISGLPPALLAGLFGVSRTTYYKWIEGATPRDARFEHLVDVLAHVKEAQRKLTSRIDVAAWLRTPISPGGRSPLTLLEQKRFSIFRGLLVRARSAEMGLSTPLPSAVTAQPLSREALKLARERVSPSPRLEDEEPVRPPDEGGNT